MEPFISKANLTFVLGCQSKEGVMTSIGWRGKTCDCRDPVFKSLSLDSVKFTLVNDDGFLQWMYLAFPEAFSAALRGTRFENDKKLSLCFENKCSLLDKKFGDTQVLRWKIEVNYLLSAGSADGVRFEPRVYELDFYPK